MVDANEHEMAAMLAASDRAGEYIESLRKTDMAQFSPEEWNRLIEVICGGYVDYLCVAQASIAEAIGKVQAQ